jgi:hypothetical protein
MLARKSRLKLPFLERTPLVTWCLFLCLGPALRNPLRAFSVMPKRITEDKENIILLPVRFPPLVFESCQFTITDARSQG